MPGIWENGTPYCHSGAFKVVADCCLGQGNQACETLLQIMPDSEWNPVEHSGCEPYVFTNMYFGPDNPRAGETAFAWVTGTAGWMFRAVAQHMLGFHPGYTHITIRPCIPAGWQECSLKRVYRGDTYWLTITNPHQSQAQVKRIAVDGVTLAGNSLKIFGDGREHRIQVTMGD